MTTVHASQPEPGEKPVYPFSEWLNGNQWTLTRGRDFWGDLAQFEQSIRASARARRLDVTVTWDELHRVLYVRASPRG